MQKIWLLPFALLIYFSAVSQSSYPDRKSISGNPGVTTFYLQTDRSTYLSGDTIWAKGYITTNFNDSISPYSLTIELTAIKDKKVLSKQTFLISGKVAPVTIPLSPELATGTYLISAYSQEILQQQQAVFTRLINVYNIFNKEREELIYKRQLIFYPEGGHLIAGDTNRVAFAFTGRSGKGSNISGKIIDSEGVLICSFAAIHNGMGAFLLEPQLGKTYFAIIDKDSSNTKYPLPGVEDKGIHLTVQSDSDQISFSIRCPTPDSASQPSFLALQMGNKKVYGVPLEKNNHVINGTIPVRDFPSGVARLSVFNQDTSLLAERLCFIDNKEYILQASFAITLLNKEYRAENLFSLNLNEAVQGTFAISVTDAGFETPDGDAQNIYSSSLLTNHLKNNVYDAGHYFDGGYKNAREGLDLVMLTNFWKGPNWEERNQHPHTVKTARGILSGKVVYKDNRKPYANSPIAMVALSEEDSTMQTITFTTDNKGMFKTGTNNIFGKNRLLFSALKKKGTFIKVELDQYAEAAVPFHFPEITGTKKIIDTLASSVYDSLLNSGEYMENVVVKRKRKSSIERLAHRYTTGLFNSLYGEVYDLTEVKDVAGNILDYLTMRYPDIKVETDRQGSYQTKARRLDGTIVPATIYLNEVQLLAIEQLYTIKPDDVAIIKVVQNMDFNEKGAVPAIAIYTRKGQDFTAAGTNYDIVYYNGYSKPSEFNKPVYTTEQLIIQPDSRITLLWNSKAATSKRINFIPVHFYNNDFTKVFKLIIEGITNDGRLLYFEKRL